MLLAILSIQSILIMNLVINLPEPARSMNWIAELEIVRFPLRISLCRT